MNIIDLIKNSINTIYTKYKENAEEIENIPDFKRTENNEEFENIINNKRTKNTETFENIINNKRTEELENFPIFYIAGSQTLPPPLPPEEEAEIIKQLSGENSKQARQTLVERNLRLVVYISKKFENTGIGIEDLISIGTIGLMKSVNTFNNDKKIKLATYASRCIENEILMYLRRINKIKGEISIDEPLNKDGDGNELLLSDVLGTEVDITSRNLEDEVDKKLLRAAIEKLNDKEKLIMQMRFGFFTGKEKTQKEVADEMGISQSYISRLEKKIISKMRKDIISKTG